MLLFESWRGTLSWGLFRQFRLVAFMRGVLCCVLAVGVRYVEVG